MTTLTTTELPAGLTSGTWNIDPSHTEAGFTVRHAGISKVRGSVAVTSGAITVGATLPESTVSVTLDPATISTGDAGRDGHLKSGDFFEVETYPTWTFTSTAVRVEGSALVVVGDLTIHGVTQSVELTTEFNGTATDPFGNLRAGFSAETEISRKEFGLTWNAALEAGGVLVADKVKIVIDGSAIKAA
ncbi:YceI family protein [Cellulomonas sp. P24]|uniref:YceI family protein n=1 Tax=Cellulomonas sp. P24 TaxID=2885206 RepID=UPI00216B0E42|nr:YceI family protein [Cellulomonas sp. P24]MCR6492352.1 YceI family protein [Cellulomonas sp. P24]